MKPDTVTKHKHEWKYSYSIKTLKGVESTYFCKPCGKFKKEKGKPEEKRAHNMGGEFSTSWRP